MRGYKQAGFAHIGLILFLLAAIAGGVFLVGRQTNLTPKASSEEISFVDDYGSVIKTTVTPTVKVKLNAPYPPAPVSSGTLVLGSPVAYELPGSNCISGADQNVECPGSAESSSQAKERKLKNPVTVSGQLAAGLDLSRPEGPKTTSFPGYLIEYCDPDGDGATNYALLKSNNQFEFQVERGKKFCVRAPKLKNYDYPPTATNSKGSSYEDQIAGIDCAKTNYKNKDCKLVASAKTDLAVDNTFNFTYTKSSPSPAPAVTTEVSLSEDPTFPSPYSSVAYKKDGMIIDYTFKNGNPGKKVLYARFHTTNGIIPAKAPAVVELLGVSPSPSSIPSSSPSSIPSSSPSSSPSVSPSPSPSPLVSPSPSLLPQSASYRRVFKTSYYNYQGNLGGLSGADQKCQQAADAQNLGGIWKAWLSDSTIGAYHRLNHASVQYKLLNGVTVADNWSDLVDGSLDSSINFTELGTYTVDAGAWTNTLATGYPKYTTASQTCNNWTDNYSRYTGTTGTDFSRNTQWTDSGTIPCHYMDSLYCFEQ